MVETVIVTGSQGFLGSFICDRLLSRGYKVVGYDNYSKYGRVSRPHDKHENFSLVEMDLAKQEPNFIEHNPSYIIAGAAMIGGITYFHKYAYDLLATNERIIANTFDAAIKCKRETETFKRIIVISSSMVFEGADIEWEKYQSFNHTTNNDWLNESDIWPTSERRIKDFPPPNSTYGFQKLSTEYFSKGAWEQYSLPYTIVRPFNAVGTGENEALGEEEVMSGNVRLMMSHVLPDLINKCLRGQDPLHVLGDASQVRCYTHGKDIARGIVMAMESEEATNKDFNISVERPTTVRELAEIVWKEINGNKPLNLLSDTPYEYDVQKRIPDVSKARELLGFTATIPLEESVREVTEWMRENMNEKE